MRALFGNPDRLAILLAFLAIEAPGAVIAGLGLRMGAGRWSARAEAAPAPAIVERIEARHGEREPGDPGDVQVTLLVSFEGGRYERPLLNPGYEPSVTWHSPSYALPDEFPEGARVRVLVNREQDVAVAYDDRAEAYGVPAFVIGFGAVWLAVGALLHRVYVADARSRVRPPAPPAPRAGRR